jgi:hypothetical protein
MGMSQEEEEEKEDVGSFDNEFYNTLLVFARKN